MENILNINRGCQNEVRREQSAKIVSGNFSKLLLACVAFLATALVGHGVEIEWRYAFGVNSMTVPQADNSHTYGVNAFISAEATYPTGIHWMVSDETFLDHDKDHLDPDHIPVWWRLHAGIDGPITRSSGPWHLLWVGDFDTVANTVSSVEREIRALAGVTTGCNYGSFTADLKAQAGYFFLEIDDDVAKTRGYDRGDYRHEAIAGSLALDASFRFTPDWKLSGHAQQWFYEDGWLQNQYLAALEWRLPGVGRDCVLTLSVEVNQYNLDPYSPANATGPYLPILPWDHDRLVKLSFGTRW